jgi:hypothetical protein
MIEDNIKNWHHTGPGELQLTLDFTLSPLAVPFLDIPPEPQ